MRVSCYKNTFTHIHIITIDIVRQTYVNLYIQKIKAYIYIFKIVYI